MPVTGTPSARTGPADERGQAAGDHGANARPAVPRPGRARTPGPGPRSGTCRRGTARRPAARRSVPGRCRGGPGRWKAFCPAPVSATMADRTTIEMAAARVCVAIGDLARQPDDVEGSTASVGIDARDAEAGRVFQDALLDRVAVPTERLVRGGVVFRVEPADGRERETRMDGFGAEHEQACDVVRPDRVAAVGHDRALGAESRVNERGVDRADGQQGRDRARSRSSAASLTTRMPWPAETASTAASPSRSSAGRRHSGPPPAAQVASRASPRGTWNTTKVGSSSWAAARGHLPDERIARTEQRGRGHHEPFADVVDRRVGHLREALLQVPEYGAPAHRHRRDRVSSPIDSARRRRRPSDAAAGKTSSRPYPKAVGAGGDRRDRRDRMVHPKDDPVLGRPRRVRARHRDPRTGSSSTPPRRGSTTSISPGPSLPRRTRPWPWTSTAPASEAQATSPSSQIAERRGRSPLRSKARPPPPRR